MDSNNPIRYSDLVAPDSAITDLIAQLNDLIATYEGAKSKIVSEAAQMEKAIEGVSGATEQQREQIKLVTTQTDRWAQIVDNCNDKIFEAKRAQAEANEANREAAMYAKLITQLNNAKEGSYNKLSAQYRLNKIALNEMSAAERAGTEEGRALERETAAIYEEMKRLQEATGKHVLNVGNYADAAKGLKTELMSLVQQMAYLKTQGQENSAEYQEMSVRAGQLKDAMLDATAEVKAMASDTRALDTVMGAATAASGGFSAYTGLTQLLGTSSESTAEMQRKLGSAIAIVNGMTAIQNALQKQSNLMVGIGVLQDKAATAAKNLKTKATQKETGATVGATIAQRIFNAVASANPYVLLAIALVTVVGALAAFAAGSNRATKEQTKLNKATAAQLDYMEKLAETRTRSNNERIEELRNELEIAGARNASLSETRALEDAIYNERVKAHDKQMQIYGEQVAGLEANRLKLERLQKTLLELQQAQAAGKNRLLVDVDLDGRIERVKVDKAIEAVQGQIDNYNRSVKVAVDLKTEGAELSTERAVQLAQRRQQAQQAAKAERDILRSAQDSRLALVRDSYKRERSALTLAANRQIEDIQTRLKTESNLTKKSREALNRQLKYIAAKYYQDLEQLQNKYMALNIAAVRETEDIQLALMAEGADKQRLELETTYKRRINDLQTTLANEKNLTATQRDEMLKQIELYGKQYQKELDKLNRQITLDQLNADATRIQLRLDAAREGLQEQVDLSIELLNKQRDIELEQNSQLAEDIRQDEADINKKWDAIILKQTAELTQKRALMLLDAQQELSASEFALLDRNERQKTQFQLRQEKARLQKILELDREAGSQMTEQERETIRNTIAAIEKESKTLPYDNFYELLGLNVSSQQQDALNTAIDSVKDSLGGIIDSYVSIKEAAVEAANAQVEAAQKALDAEIEARNAGYANNVETARKNLLAAKSAQEKAQREQEKAAKAQMAIDTLTQSSSLITASANLWKSFSSAGVLGPALAIAAIATMWGSFAYSKVKALQATQSEKYGEGTVELLEGGSHASGHDIDLGMTRNGRRRKAEGGEYFAIVNKRNSRKYGALIPAVINAFNDGTFESQFQKTGEMMSRAAVQYVGADVSTLEREVTRIRKQGDERRTVEGDMVVVRYKNLTRKIKS